MDTLIDTEKNETGAEVKGQRRDRDLFRNLFGDPQKTFARIAQGISACSRNVLRLLEDVRILLKEERFSSAHFIFATAREEHAKGYLLADMCLPDPFSHDVPLRKLCAAFYDHVTKYAYYQLAYFTYQQTAEEINRVFPTIKQVGEAWNAEITHWWPATDSFPAMPTQTVFDREYPLYVDFGDYDSKWLEPVNGPRLGFFKIPTLASQLSELQEQARRWRQAEEEGVCSPPALRCLNEVFKKHYVGEAMTWEEVLRLYDKVARNMEKEDIASHECFLASPLVRWPLYHFLQQKRGTLRGG